MFKNVTPFNMSNATWSLKLSKESFKFSGAHFTTFSKEKAELLHGHNYYVSVSLDDCKKLDHGLIIDLNTPKKMIKTLLESLDERVLIADKNPYTKQSVTENQVNLSFNGKIYSFPKEDCTFLPIENITIEELAGYIGSKLEPAFKSYPIKSFTVDVAESRGQSCSYKVEL